MITKKDKTQIMGILNVTPDSFSGDGVYKDLQSSVEKAALMLEDGADIIDIGGESTRPGAKLVDTKEEIDRVIPVIKEIREKLGNDFIISVDTNKHEVAELALDSGANWLNSMGGFRFDQALVSVVKNHKCKIVIYHTRDLPDKMQVGKMTYTDVIEVIQSFFEEQILIGERAGINKDQFILDPGIGFGKTVEQNVEIIKRLSEFKILDLPILIGVSRKSHLGMILQDQLGLKEIPGVEARLEAGLAETAIAIQNGAEIVRTHDVLETKRFAAVLDFIHDRITTSALSA